MIDFRNHSIAEQAFLHRNDRLNPDLWDGDRLIPDVRTKLLNFGEAFRRFAHIPPEAVQDVLMVGGNAGIFYNESSDIDVHLLVSRSQLGLGPFVDDYLQDKKTLWTAKYDVRVKGYQVEPYAQDVSERHVKGQGIYSLMRDEWIQRPTEAEYDPATDKGLARSVTHYRRAIDGLGPDADVDDVDALRNKLSGLRSRSISRSGELGKGNLLFKALRLSGHLDRLKDIVRGRTGRDLSLE